MKYENCMELLTMFTEKTQMEDSYVNFNEVNYLTVRGRCIIVGVAISAKL